MTEFIAHSRTKGSKNGRRRYQNENGTWTNEGKERRREEYARQRRAALPGEVSAEYSNRGRGTTSGETFEFKKNREGKYTYAGPKSRRANMGDIDQIARNADKIPGSAKDISDGISRIKGKKKRENLSKYSDEELRRKVNRLNLERQYDQLTANDKSRGKEKVDGILQVAGGVTGIVASGTTIAYIIWKIRHGQVG